jgi:ABC-type branched-subunit amino acid transport system ATPase component
MPMNMTVLLVEQNATAALAIADRAYVLENGRITLSGGVARDCLRLRPRRRRRRSPGSFDHAYPPRYIRLISGLVFGIIKQLREENMTVLLVEQNATAALAIADRAYVRRSPGSFDHAYPPRYIRLISGLVSISRAAPDKVIRPELFGIIKQLREENMTVLLVEQNATAALAIADRARRQSEARFIQHQ